jgi:hypothetical protein
MSKGKTAARLSGSSHRPCVENTRKVGLSAGGNFYGQ